MEDEPLTQKKENWREPPTKSSSLRRRRCGQVKVLAKRLLRDAMRCDRNLGEEVMISHLSRSVDSSLRPMGFRSHKRSSDLIELRAFEVSSRKLNIESDWDNPTSPKDSRYNL